MRDVVSGGGNDFDDMTITTAMSSITLGNEFIEEGNTNNKIKINNSNPPHNDDDHGSNSASNNITKKDTNSFLWEKALINTCLQHATIASSCAQVYRQVSDLKNNRSGHEEIEEALLIVDNADVVCEILGNREDGCAYIRWDGSIANHDLKQFNDVLYVRQKWQQQHHQHPHLSMERQRDIPRYYTTAVVECKTKFPSNGSGGTTAHTATTSIAESNNYIKLHHNYSMQQHHGESILSSSSSTTMNHRQVEQLAQLSGMYLTDKVLLLGKGDKIRRKHKLVDAESSAIIPTTATAATPPPPSSWSIPHYPMATSLFQLLKSGTTRVIHGALSVIEGAEESDRYFDSIGNGHNQSITTTSGVEEDESSSLQVRKLLSKDVASETILGAAFSNDTIRLEDENDDDVTTLTGRKKRQHQFLGENSIKHNIMSVLPPVSSNDMLISIVIVAYTCRHLLTFAQNVILSSRCDPGGGDMVEEEEEGVDVRSRAAEKCNTNYSDFFVPMLDGDDSGARIVMYREGWGTCSFGMFCRKAGSYCTLQSGDAAASASASSPFTTSATMTELAQYGKILSDMTKEEVDLLATTLCKSNFALVEKDIIVLFPGGVTADLSGAETSSLISSSVFALFQIHVTKIAITNKIVRLERDANVAKNNAIKARRDNKNTTELALMHMRRRKAALDELDRCASLLFNLDACEIRLERAREDVRLVQSYTYLRAALQDVRKSRDDVLVGSNSSYKDVEELMFDIREEMNEMNETNRRMNEMMTIEQYAEINEAELNEEFRRLELECESTVNQQQSHLEVNVDQGSVKQLNQPTPMTGPKNDGPASNETVLLA